MSDHFSRPHTQAGIGSAPFNASELSFLERSDRRNDAHGIELSLVVPFYNEEDAVPLFFDRIVPVMNALGLRYEIVCVNDGSRDKTFSMLAAASLRHRGIVRVIDLSRNFGKEAALTAAIDHAVGRAVIPIDADLQDPPEVIPDLVARWREGNDVVLAIRADRSSDSWMKRKTAGWFYRFINKISDVDIPANAGDFRLMDRKVIDAMQRLPERARFMKGMFAWVGFKTATVGYTREKRSAGTTKFRYWRLWNFALEGIVSFSSLPLRVWSYLGFAIAIAAAVYTLVIVAKTLIFGVDVPGYASIIVLLLVSSALNMIGLGIIGEYVARVFVEVKNRPIYVVRERIGLDDQALRLAAE
ncbi:glycosyltransferase family 2 protein [Roseiterribacter gracilis]|uniref:Bactoprenol glucosyl transferase n=1 Tax=Roseiterribacter gracilis TaxID=2812848 RepID=A0A8S8XK81_9PROT|nr:bactoprenol glucosyl transferase [Rhodospirillales bacterium TMPK1]